MISNTLLSVLLGCCACAADAGSVDGGKTTKDERAGVSPAVTKGDKKFFGKDYPWDKRPEVDVFHFKHPYPVVQDSDDFDKDYVKDENSDDGSYQAQTDYDQLRHKLAKQKADVAKALSKKSGAEKELQDAMRRKDQAENKARIAAQRKAAKRAAERAAQHRKGETTSVDGQHVKAEAEVDEAVPKLPGGIASPGDVKVATDDTQRAMDALEECKKELAAAREALKKLMKEHEEAKQEQRKTEAALESADVHRKESEAAVEGLDSSVKTHYKQYLDARESYLQQQALVAKMEQDIKAAAAKVKAFRDGADKEGGVYPAPTKNGATSSASLLFAGLLASFAFSAQ